MSVCVCERERECVCVCASPNPCEFQGSEQGRAMGRYLQRAGLASVPGKAVFELLTHTHTCNLSCAFSSPFYCLLCTPEICLTSIIVMMKITSKIRRMVPLLKEELGSTGLRAGTRLL